MNISYESSNIINAKLSKIKENKEYKVKEYIKETKNNSNKVEMVNIYSNYLK